jgi:outer membrane receptor protein involved in Fe transport
VCLTALTISGHAGAQTRDTDDASAVHKTKPARHRRADNDGDDKAPPKKPASVAKAAAHHDADGDDDDDDTPASAKPAPMPPAAMPRDTGSDHDDKPAPAKADVPVQPAPIQDADGDDAPAKPAPAAQAAVIHDADGDDDGDDTPSAQPQEVIVTARRMDAARASITPNLGASTYTISNRLVELRPGGEAASLGQVLLQAPGVAQTPSGQLAVRGQTSLQYRINNVIIPEGFTDLSESLSARMEQSIDLITGALPAQYGLQVGGVVNITTQNGVYQQGGQAQLYGGGQGEFEPAIEYSTVVAGTNVFTSGSYLHNNAGLNTLDGSANPRHDKTDQWEGFGYFDHVLNDHARLSLILGATDERFQLPHVGGQDAATLPATPAFQRPLSVNGTTSYLSENLGGSERDSGQYAILSYLYAADKLSFQASVFGHASSYRLDPDITGDLLFTGLAQAIHDRETTTGLQVEGAYKVAAAHTLRAGILANTSRQDSDVASTVLAVDGSGRQTSMTPKILMSSSVDTSKLFSAFLQDEWKLTHQLTLNTGLRFDHVQGAANGDKLSPRVNLVWADETGTTVHGGYARYFVPPQDNEGAGRTLKLVGTTGAPPGTGNGALQAETDDYYDLGVQQKVSKLTLGADAWWRRATNLLGVAPIDQSLLQRTFNYDHGRLHGIELTANYAAGPVTAWSNLAFARAEGCGLTSAQYGFTPAEQAYAANHCLPTSNDQRLTASAGMSYAIGGLHLSGDVLHGSGTPRTAAGGSPNGARMPAWTVVNLSALYRVTGLGGKPVDLKLDIVNTFDARYQLTDGTAFGGGVPQWGARRGVFIGAEQSF